MELWLASFGCKVRAYVKKKKKHGMVNVGEGAFVEQVWWKCGTKEFQQARKGPRHQVPSRGQTR